MSPQRPPGQDSGRWRRVEEICDAALKLANGERDAYLASACGGDRELRHEVDALLAHEQSADGFLSAPLGAVAAAFVDPPRNLIGRSIAGYDIVAQLGQGGMGEVYRARDRQLGRDVAIKVLPAAVANDHERLKRFEREARLLASVNHAGIGAIYGVVAEAGVRALVLELIEGETLSVTLSRGLLKIERALALAAQIADALDHAHRRGITHRDLKPSNIMIAASGVKLLDFGVGKLAAPVTGGTMTRESTLSQEGAIIGTLHYMAPEQLEGRAADARSDVFSFGAVLYEMLSGRRAFDGQSQASIIAAVLEAPTPKLTGVAGPLGPRIERVVTKCLAKNPDDRWQSARDLADELRWLGTEASTARTIDAVGTREVPSTTRRRSIPILAAVAALIVVAVLGWTATWRQAESETPDTNSLIRFAVQPREGRVPIGNFDISSAGDQLVYQVRLSTGSSLLHIRRFDQLEGVPLKGTEGGFRPVFSPDGQWIAYAANGAIRKIGVRGDAPPVVVTTSDIGTTFGLEWPTPDTIFLVARNQPIRRVPAGGGRPENVTTLERGTEVDHHGPVLLPSGRALLFAVHGQRNRFSIAVQDLRTGERRTLFEGFTPRYSPTGHLLFDRGSAIMAVAFDEASLQVSGDPVTLVERVPVDARSGDSGYRLSRNGTLVFQHRALPRSRELIWVDRKGREAAVPIPAQAIDMPRISPDGKQLAYVVEEVGRRDIWIYTWENGRQVRLTQAGDNWSPIWTPDGTALIYGRDGRNVAEVVRHSLDGATLDTLGSDVADLWPHGISSDSQHLVVGVQPPTDELHLALLDRGSQQLHTLLQNIGEPRDARLSPDGRWLAYAEQVSNRTEVFIQGFPEPGVRRQVSVEGGANPVWARDGKELFFRRGRRMYAVGIVTGGGLTWGPPTMLFEGDYFFPSGDYEVAPDGRFLMNRQAPLDSPVGQLDVVVNWRNELITRVPTSR